MKSNFRAAIRNATALSDANDAGFRGNYGKENLDIIARAQVGVRVKAASVLPEPNEELLDRFALEALAVDDYLGALSEGDEYAKLLSGKSSLNGMECIPSLIKQLEAAGNKREADIVQQRFPDALNQHLPNPFASKSEPEEQVLQSLRETAGLTRHCLDAITNGDKAEAKADADKLLDLYQSGVISQQWKPPCALTRQNLYCTILNVARKLSDHGWYSQSNALLDKLDTAATAKKDWSAALNFILIEKTINAERANAKTEVLWRKLDEAPFFDISSDGQKQTITYDFPPSERLRLLGIAFYNAGELSRADSLIDRAIKVYSEVDTNASAEHQIQHSTREQGAAGDQVLLMLSAACVKAAEQKFDEANSFIDKALQGDPVPTLAYGGRIAELARIYAENNRSAEAIAFLKRARDKNIPVAFRMPRSSTSSPYVVEFWLAKLLFDTGRPAEAHPIIEGAIEHAVHPIQPPNAREQVPSIRPDDYDYAPFILAGNCALAEKDYGAAAVRFEQAGLSRRVGSLPVSDKPMLEKYWLQKAIDIANLATNFANTDKARLYMELAKTMQREPPEKAFDLDKTACELLPDSDSRKPALLAEMARLSKQINYRNSAVGKTDSGSTNTASEKATSKSNDNLDEITLLRRAAEAAEKTGEKAAYGRYFRLATIEAQSPENLNQAVQDCEHAIKLYAGIAAPMSESLAYSRIAPLSPDLIASSLFKNGRTADGIKLMEEATTKVEAANGMSSRETQAQLQALMQFYIYHNDEERALQSLDRVLDCTMKPSTIFSRAYSSHADPGFSMEPEYRWAESVATKNQKLSETILSKVLASQQKQLPSDDLQIADTYLSFALVHAIQKDDQATLADYQRAFDIRKLYFGEQKTVNYLFKEYLDLLRKFGKGAEADRLENLRQTQAQLVAEAQEKRTQAQAELAERGAPSAVGTRKDLDIEPLKIEYEKAKAEAPYSYNTSTLLRRLEGAATFHNDWALALECANQELALSKHFLESAKVIAKNEERLIELYIKAGKVDDAQVWLDKLGQENGVRASDLSRYQEMVLEEYIRVGRLDDARKQVKILWPRESTRDSELYRCDRELIEALKKAGKDTEANQEIAQLFAHHSQWIPNLRRFSQALYFSKLAIERGETKWLPALLWQGEQLMPLEQDNFYIPQFAELWRKCGDIQQANKLMDKYRAFISQMVQTRGYRVSAPDPSKNKPSVPQTKSGLDFPIPTVPSGYSFNFAALSSDSLTLDRDARVSVDQKDRLSFAGTYGELKSAQNANHASDLSFIYGSYPGSPIVPASSSNANEGRQMNIPAVPRPPFKPALEVPEHFHNSFPGSHEEGTEVGLGAGADYQTFSGLQLDALRVEGKGRVRLFISENAAGINPAFHLTPMGLVNAQITNGPPLYKESSIELWYAGTGTIKLDADSTFNGIIYAPNAKIEIGPGNASFFGAMIAKDIVVLGDSHIYWDPALANWKEDLELH
jgi:hypothetical protein